MSPFCHFFSLSVSRPISSTRSEVSVIRFPAITVGQFFTANRYFLRDLLVALYEGGFIRATHVARMAAEAGMTITPHMSGGNTGWMEVLQFASFTPNIGPYMEYKGGLKQAAKWFGVDFQVTDGKIKIPAAPGLGLMIDPQIIAKAEKIKSI